MYIQCVLSVSTSPSWRSSPWGRCSPPAAAGSSAGMSPGGYPAALPVQEPLKPVTDLCRAGIPDPRNHQKYILSGGLRRGQNCTPRSSFRAAGLPAAHLWAAARFSSACRPSSPALWVVPAALVSSALSPPPDSASSPASPPASSPVSRSIPPTPAEPVGSGRVVCFLLSTTCFGPKPF